MSIVTKDWLLKTIAELEEERDATPGAVNEDAAMALAAMKLALASLEAEPYGYVHKSAYEQAGSCGLSSDHEAYRDSSTHIAVYTAPPVTASVPQCFLNAVSALESLYRNGQKQNWNERYTTDMAYASGVLKACRAAMLQGGEPVTTAYKLPDDFDFDHFNDPVWFEAIIGLDNMYDPVTRTLATVALELNRKLDKPELTVWYGAMPESNGKTNWTAILHRKGEGRCMDGFTIDRSEYPGRVLYAADRVRYLIGEKSDRPSILDYDAEAHSGYVRPGNSPVIPDGWALVPIEPTMSQEFAGYRTLTDTGKMSRLMKTRLSNIYRAMLAAAPQQEVK